VTVITLLAAALAMFHVAPQQAIAATAKYCIAAVQVGSSYETTFTNAAGFNSSYLFDVELWDKNNKRVSQYFTTKTVNDDSDVTITQPITAGLPVGVYTVKAGLFTPDWAASLLWSERVGQVSVGGQLSVDISSTTSGATFETVFATSQQLNGQYLFDVELWDKNNKRVFQWFDTMAVNNSSKMTISRLLPSTIPAGTYTAKAGLFTPNWTTSLKWDDNTGSATVGAAPSTPVVTLPSTPVATVPPMTAPAVTVPSTSIPPATVPSTMPAVTTPTTLTVEATSVLNGSSFETTFTASQMLNGNYLFDVELWTKDNKRVFQSFDTMTVKNSPTVKVSRIMPSNLPTGTYVAKAGVFSPDWSEKFLWDDNTGSLTTGSPNTVPVTQPPTTTTITTTTSTTSTTVPTMTKPFSMSATRSGMNIDATFTANNAGTYLLDIELWDANKKKVFQYFEPRTFEKSGERETVRTYVPTYVADGAYTVKGGVFSTDWKVMHFWETNAGSLSVSKAEAASAFNPAGNGRTLMFSDEFDGTALDSTKWLTCSRQLVWWKNQCYGHGKELQTYVPENVNIVNFAEGGRGLRLSATNDGSRWGFGHDDVRAGDPMYKSGMISTSPNDNFSRPGYKPFSFKYGYYEVRMKSPRGQGMWPAAWAFPEDNVGPQELDLIEIIGNDTDTAHMTVHYPGGNSSQKLSLPGVDFADDFHTFGMDWKPGQVDWYIDGKLARTTFSNAGSVPDKPMYIMLNLAVGGWWPGAPDSSTQFPAHMDVDWVRVWSR
jgi:hypothetical protein